MPLISDTAVAAQSLRMNDAKPIHFASMKSRATPGTGAADRTDPYYHGLFSGGSAASWLGRGLAERLSEDDFRRVPIDMLRISEQEATDKFLATRRHLRLQELAAIQAWRVITSEQLSTITGNLNPAMTRSSMKLAWQAGMIERGSFLSELTMNKGGGLNHLYRPVVSNQFSRLIKSMTYDEWVRVTAAQPWDSGSQHDRHDLLATELGLRIAEFCDIGSIIGEKLCGTHELAYGVPGPGYRKSADVGVIRHDGMTILIEITSSTGITFDRKVAAWAKLLSDLGPNGHLAVVFLEAGRIDNSGHIAGGLWKRIRNSVGVTAWEDPSYARRGVPDRMGIARWDWWSPRGRSGSEAFRFLDVFRPNGTARPGEERWVQASMLDPIDVEFTPSDPAAALAMLHATKQLSSTPHWLRDPHPESFEPLLMKHHGYDRAPSPPPVRPEYNAAKEVRRRAARDAQAASGRHSSH